MINPITPEKVYEDLNAGKINKKEALEILISLIEGNENLNIVTNSILAINKISLKNERIFKILENLLISDDNPEVRSTAAKVIITNYLKEVVSPLKWTIQNERSTIVLKALFDSFENIDNEYTRPLKKELLLSIFGVVEEEIEFFLELDSYCEEFRDMNINFYKNYQTNNIEDVIKGKAVYAINEGHVIALNLAGWTLNVDSIIQDSLFKNLKALPSNTHLPESIGNLVFLKYLNLNFCSRLKKLPDSIVNLQKLEVLLLNQCFMLDELPKNIGKLSSLQSLELTCNNLRYLPDSIGELYNLRTLIYSGENRWLLYLSSIPNSIGKMQNLEKLVISDCQDLITLPKTIENLSSLQELDLSYCIRLESLPENIGKIDTLKKINLIGCKALKSIPDSIKNSKSIQLLINDDSSEWDGGPFDF